MDINHLNGEQLQNIIAEIVYQKLISPDKIKEIILSVPSNDMKKASDTLHALTCNLDHDKECAYYREETNDISTCWTKPDHLTWLNNTIELMEEIGYNDPRDLRSGIAHVTKLKGEIEDKSLALFQRLFTS